MRSIRRLFSVVLSVAALVGVVGCDSEQPLQVGEQTVAITVEGGNTMVPLFRMFDMFIDNDGDNEPDDGEFYLFCRTFGSNGTPNGAPVNYGLQAVVYRAETGQTEMITAAATGNTDANLTPYDPMVNEIFSVQAPITVMGNTFKFCQSGPFGVFPDGCRLPRQGSALVREAVMATSNPLSDLDPVTYGWGQGLCSLGDPGPAVLDGANGPLTLLLDKGDTLTVTLKRGPLPPELVNGSGGSLFITQPSIGATVTLDGSPVSVDGDSQTGSTEDSTVQFSLTTR